jgi:hypothetical protein
LEAPHLVEQSHEIELEDLAYTESQNSARNVSSEEDSDEIDAEISRLEEEVDTDEDIDYEENPGFEPTARPNQLLDQTETDDIEEGDTIDTERKVGGR